MTKAAQTQQIPTCQVVIHKAFIEALYNGQKCACMVQGNFVPGQKLILEKVMLQVTVPIAEAVVYAVAGLKIDPKTETIFQRGNFSWIKLQKDKATQVIKNEGFDHPYDFWKLHEGPFEVNQIYFDKITFYK